MNNISYALEGGVCLEIFVKYTHKESVYWEVAGNTMAAPKTFYDYYDNLKFLGQTFSIPQQTEYYLTHKYGDWEKTIKNWDAAVDEKYLIS